MGKKKGSNFPKEHSRGWGCEYVFVSWLRKRLKMLLVCCIKTSLIPMCPYSQTVQAEVLDGRQTPGG